MSDVKKIMEMIKENDVTYVDVRFTDPRGKMQHLSQHVDTINEERVSVQWKEVHGKDQILLYSPNKNE